MTMLTPKKFPVLTAGLGSLTLILRLGLFLLGRDEKNLLIPGHPLAFLIWAATAAAVVMILLFLRKQEGSSHYTHNFAPSVPAAIGTFALAGGILVCVITGGIGMRLDLLRSICGILAVPALVWIGIQRFQGKRPVFLLHAAVCLYLMLYTVTHYQIWSSHPQIQDWFFAMCGMLCLSLFAYYQTAFDVDMGKRRMQLASGLLAAFFCIANLAGGEDVPLYLGGAVWALTNLCSLTPVRRRRKNPITEAGKDDANASA